LESHYHKLWVLESHYLKLWGLESHFLKTLNFGISLPQTLKVWISLSQILNIGISLSQTLSFFNLIFLHFEFWNLIFSNFEFWNLVISNVNEFKGRLLCSRNKFMYLGYLKYSVNQNGLFSLSGHRPHSWYCITTLRYNLWPLLWDCKVMLFCRLSVMFINKEWIRCGLSAMRDISMV
jgi:hypothetical protein